MTEPIHDVRFGRRAGDGIRSAVFALLFTMLIFMLLPFLKLLSNVTGQHRVVADVKAVHLPPPPPPPPPPEVAPPPPQPPSGERPRPRDRIGNTQ